MQVAADENVKRDVINQHADKNLNNHDSAAREDRKRSAKRQMSSIHQRARSFESAEERKPETKAIRSQSLRRRDGSWDKLWKERGNGEGQIKQIRQTSIPGKINTSFWEQQTQMQEFRPPKTPPPRRQLRENISRFYFHSLKILILIKQYFQR